MKENLVAFAAGAHGRESLGRRFLLRPAEFAVEAGKRDGFEGNRPQIAVAAKVGDGTVEPPAVPDCVLGFEWLPRRADLARSGSPSGIIARRARKGKDAKRSNRHPNIFAFFREKGLDSFERISHTYAMFRTNRVYITLAHATRNTQHATRNTQHATRKILPE